MEPNILQAREAAFTGQEHVGKWYQPGPEQLQNNPQHRLEHEQSDVQTFVELGEIAEQATLAPGEEALDPEDLLEPETRQAVKELIHSETPEPRKAEILESLWQRGGKSAVISIGMGTTLGMGRFKLDGAIEGLEPNLDIKLSDLLIKDERDAAILTEVVSLDSRLDEQLHRPVFEEDIFNKGKMAPTGAVGWLKYEAQGIAGEATVLSMTGSEVADLLSSADPLDKELGTLIENYVIYDKDWNDLLAAKLVDGVPDADRQQKVEDFINAGHGTVVTDTCLEAFPDLDHKTIASKLIETKQGSTLTSNFEKFEGLSQQEVFKALDASGQAGDLAYNLDKFPELDVTEVALAVVRSGNSFNVTMNAEKFSSGDQEAIVDAVLQSGDDSILFHLDAFPTVDQNALVRKLEANFPDWHTFRLKNLHGLEPAVALEIAQRRPDSIPDIFKAIDSFTTLNDPDFIDAVLAGGYAQQLVGGIEKISPEDPSFIISKVLDSTQPWTLIDSVEALHVDKAKLVSALVREGQLDANGALEKLAPFDAQTAFEFYKTNPDLFLKYVESFELNNTTYLLMVADGLYTMRSPYDIRTAHEKLVGVDPEILAAVRSPSQAVYQAGDYLISHRTEFPDITDQKLIELLASSNRVHELFRWGKDIVNPKVLAEYLIGEGDYRTILYHPDRFDFIDKQDLYDRLVKSEEYGLVIDNRDQFEQYDPKVMFTDLVAKGKFNIVVGSIKHFSEHLDAPTMDNFAVGLLSTFTPETAAASVSRILDLKLEIELPRLGQLLLEQKQGKLLVTHRQNFPNISDVEIYDTLVERGSFDLIVGHSRTLNLESGQLFDLLIENSEFGLVQRNIPIFARQLTTETIELIAQNSSDLNYLVDSLTRAGISESTLPRSLTLAIDIDGEFAVSELVSTITGILSGEEIQDEGLRLLGVTKVGEAGVEQLKAGLNKFTEKLMITGQIDIAQVRSNPVLQSTLMRLTRFDSSSFGRNDRQTFEALLAKVQQRSNSGSVETITPSTVSVAMLDKEARATFEVSEDGASEWRTYVAQVKRAKDILKEDGSLNMDELNLLLGEVELLVNGRVEDTIAGTEKMRQKIAAKPELADKLQPKLEEQLALVESLRQIDRSTLMNFDTFFTHIQTLAPFKEMRGPIGTMMTVAALGQSGRRPDAEVRVDKDGKPIAPTLDEVNEMADFVGRITNQETWGPLFGAMGESKAIDTILSIDALTSNIRRAKTIAASGTMPLQLITTNGLLMELSGHIGDACWASRYDSIAETFPNFSSVIMVQNAGTKHARMAGSSMLIEASSADGEPLLIIRGLNPIQNVITQLSTTEFLDSFIDYVKQMAAQSGRRVAMVIDDHSGGAGTNRPDLHEAMLARSASLPKAALNPNDLTTFNGYDISQKTYFV